MSHSHKSMLGVLIIAILSVFFVGSLFFLCRRKLFPLLKQKWSCKGSLKDEKLMLRRFQLVELERATKNFSKDCLLGSGAFGNVYRGTFEVEGTLAIKKAHAASSEAAFESKALESCEFGGFCEETGVEGARVLVYEYVTNCSLLEYIMGKGGMNLTWRQRVNIAIGTAKGTAPLHDGIVPSIIHRDIKPSNILVGDGFEAKLSDFGLVKSGPVGDHPHVSTQIKGTPGFGVILLQLVAVRPAVDTTKNQSNYHIINWVRPSIERGNIEEILDANLLSEPCNMEMMLKMGQLGLRCVVKNPEDRPTMTQVWQELEDALYSVDSFIGKHPSRSSRISLFCQSIDQDYSQSFVSIDGVKFQRFRVEMDSMSFQSTSLRCFEASSVNIDADQSTLRGISEERNREEETKLN
ncbi:hypothetical protein SLEP1_g52230 [Rubroshorea leprosula]|uniref:Protein kinase domain-containing protein n=1 Tax=Rubroshorea leprosula TaxID=152421 RepID=A0AAV5M5L8_9ROSI|nr:hypothetical protein SLEP1_g52230 [Rubroshorea leprosula]